MIRGYIERLVREIVEREVEKRLRHEGEWLDRLHDRVMRVSKDSEELQQKMWSHQMPWDIQVPASAKVETEPQGYQPRYPKDILQALVNARLVVDESGKLRMRKPAPEAE